MHLHQASCLTWAICFGTNVFGVNYGTETAPTCGNSLLQVVAVLFKSIDDCSGLFSARYDPIGHRGVEDAFVRDEARWRPAGAMAGSRPPGPSSRPNGSAPRGRRWRHRLAHARHDRKPCQLGDSNGWSSICPQPHDALSAISCAGRIQTSVLILRGAVDTNVPLGQVVNLHRALRHFDGEHEFANHPGKVSRSERHHAARCPGSRPRPVPIGGFRRGLTVGGVIRRTTPRHRTLRARQV